MKHIPKTQMVVPGAVAALAAAARDAAFVLYAALNGGGARRGAGAVV